MRYTVKTQTGTIAQVAVLVDACELAIFMSRQENAEVYVYDRRVLIARVIGSTITIKDRERFNSGKYQSVAVRK